jgi:hypothetical protein
MPGVKKLYQMTLPRNPYTDRLMVETFSQFMEDVEVELSEKDFDSYVEHLDWDDIQDLYESDELVVEEYLEEKISAQSRLRRKQAFARFKGKRSSAKRIKLRRASTATQLKKRAVVAARRAMYKKLLRGRDKSTLSASEKDRVEGQIKRMKNLQSSLATRLMPKIRSIEQKRLSSAARK